MQWTFLRAALLATSASLTGVDQTKAEYGYVSSFPVAESPTEVTDLTDAGAGELYAAISGSRDEVVRISASGEIEASFSILPEPTNYYHLFSIDTDGAGDITVLDPSDGQYEPVRRFAPDGTKLAEWRIQVPGSPRDIATDESGNSYVPMTGVPNLLVKFAPDGTELARWRLDRPAGGIDLRGTTIYLSVENSIVRMATDGTPLGTWPLEGTGDPYRPYPSDISVTAQNILLLRFAPVQTSIATGETSPGRAQIEVLGAAAEPLDEFGCFGYNVDERLYDAGGIAVDADGLPVVADGNRLKRFASGLGSTCAVETDSRFTTLRSLGARFRCPFDACEIEVDGIIKTKGVRTPLQAATAYLEEDVPTLVRMHFQRRAHRRLVRKHLNRRDGKLHLEATVLDEGGRTETQSAVLTLVG